MAETLPAKQQDKGVSANTERPNLRALLEGDLFREQLMKALPKHLTPERFIRIAVTTMNRTPKLAQCEQGSFFNALLTLSQLGLEPDGRRAHLIPFENKSKGIMECTLILDYKGIIELIYNTGDISFIHADVVCENDEFEYDRGVLRAHKINFRQSRGPAYAAYTLFRFKDGTEKVEVMAKEEIYAVRDKSKAWKAYKQYGTPCPWSDQQSELEMWKKTTLRRGSKWVKLAPEQREIVELDDDQIIHPGNHGKETGKSLVSRFQTAPETAALPHVPAQDEPSAPPAGDASAGTLTGPRLAIWEKVLEMSGGDMFEAGKILSNLSGKKVTEWDGLLTISDQEVAEIQKKIGGGK